MYEFMDFHALRRSFPTVCDQRPERLSSYRCRRAIFSVVVALRSRALRPSELRNIYTGVMGISSFASRDFERSRRFEVVCVQADARQSKRFLVADVGVTSVSHVGPNGRGFGWCRLDN